MDYDIYTYGPDMAGVYMRGAKSEVRCVCVYFYVCALGNAVCVCVFLCVCSRERAYKYPGQRNVERRKQSPHGTALRKHRSPPLPAPCSGRGWGLIALFRRLPLPPSPPQSPGTCCGINDARPLRASVAKEAGLGSTNGAGA